MFETNYQPLSAAHPEWGHIAILPWDTAIFEFPVADFRAGDVRTVAPARAEFNAALEQWAEANRVELVACSIPGADAQWRLVLARLGFDFVDYTLEGASARVQVLQFPKTRVPVRLATPDDRAEVERIAENVFRVGRYHADPRFPRDLADKRYRTWVRNAFASISSNSRMYVTGEPDEVRGFLHVNLKGDSAYFTLLGVDRRVQEGLTPFSLFFGVVNLLKAEGVRKIASKLSAVNTPMMNVAIYAGSRFGNPQVVFHWHAPHAPHLLPEAAIYDLPAE